MIFDFLIHLPAVHSRIHQSEAQMALLKGHPREKRGRAVSQQQPGESHAAFIGSGFWNNFATSIWNLVLLILRMTVRQHWRQGRQTKCCLLLTLYTTLEWVLQSKLLCRIWVRLCGLSFCDAWQLKSWSQIAAIFSQSSGCNSHVTAKCLLLVSRSGILICSVNPIEWPRHWSTSLAVLCIFHHDSGRS